MALFGSKKEESTIRKIKPTVVRCESVPKELNKIAKDYDTKIENVDFNILSVQTYIKKSANGDWSEVDKYELKNIPKKDFLSEDFFIKQVYEIEVFSKSKIKNSLDDFKLLIGANATKCKIYMQVKEGSVLRYYDGLRDDLKEYINKHKVRAGIFIDVFDKPFYDTVAKLYAEVKVSEVVDFENVKTYLIAESYEPTDTIDAQIVFHYKQDEKKDNDRVDYANRGFIQSVQKDELLIEYLKPRPGEPGRACNGVYIPAKEPKEELSIDFEIDEETIYIKEDEESIKYYAKQNGYIAFEDNKYTVKSEADIDEISFKTTGSITVGVDSDVTVKVTEKDLIKDAIGSGMDVEVTKVDVEGNVGSNTNIVAKTVKIGGQTHKTSNIKADEIEINIHKGTLKGKKVKVTRLEHGYIEANEVRISQAVGGTIKAREITIDVCGSYVKASCSAFIIINSMRGSENIFTIDPRIKPSDDNIEKNQDFIDELEEKIYALTKEQEKYLQIVKKNIAPFNDLKKRLINYKKNGLKPPKEFIKQYKIYQAQKDKLLEIKKEIKDLQYKLDIAMHKVNDIQEDILKARIINKDRWMGYNEIKAHLIDPPLEIVYRIEEDEKNKVFGVVKLEEGVYKIMPLNEDF